MQEPLGVLVGLLADSIGISDVSLKLLICASGSIGLGIGFHLRAKWVAP